MLRQLAGKKQSNGRLYFATGYGSSLAVLSQMGRLLGNSFEYVMDEGIHDAHGFARYASVGVDLFKNLVNVDAKALPPSSMSAVLAARTTTLLCS